MCEMHYAMSFRGFGRSIAIGLGNICIRGFKYAQLSLDFSSYVIGLEGLSDERP